MDFNARHTLTAKPTSWRKQYPLRLEQRRCALLGNAFQCGVVAWLLAHWAVKAELLSRIPTVEDMRAARSVGGAEPQGVRAVDLGTPGAVADPSVRLATELVRRADVRGSDVRLDTGEFMRADLWPRRPVNPDQWSWRVAATWKWRQSSHITVLEVRAAFGALRWRVRHQRWGRCRCVHLMDSQAGLGVVTRCRSSSHRLNVVVKRMDALALAASLWPVYGYSETDVLPADAPSRGQVSGTWARDAT